MKPFIPTTVMKRLFLIWLFIVLPSTNLMAYDIMQAVGGRTLSLSNCSVALNDFWSCFNNPAGFASQEHITAGISYHNKFMLKELGHKNIGLILPLNIGSIAVTASQFGYKHYNENIIGISCARSFGPNLRIGLKLDYLFFKFSGNYKNKSVPTFEIGMQYNISESLCLGAYVFNPINVKLNTLERDKIPIIMRLGFSYYVNKEFLITSEIEENFEYNFSYRFSIEYCIYNKVFVRSGFQLNPEFFTFGIGYDYNRFVVDVSAQMNQRLGASLSCSFVFIIKQIA